MARQDRAIRTSRSILEAAARVFGERGHASATAEEILGRAGVTRGAFRVHFSSQEEVALGVQAGVCLALDQGARDLDRSAAFRAWADQLAGIPAAGGQGELLLRHVLPSIATPAILAALDLSPERGERVFHEYERNASASRATNAGPIRLSWREPPEHEPPEHKPPECKPHRPL